MSETTVMPTTGDSGFTYGQDIIGLFKFGVGAYFNSQNVQAGLESKQRYDSLNGQLYQNGQVASPLLPTGGTSYLPLLLGVGALVAIIFLIKD